MTSVAERADFERLLTILGAGLLLAVSIGVLGTVAMVLMSPMGGSPMMPGVPSMIGGGLGMLGALTVAVPILIAALIVLLLFASRSRDSDVKVP